MGFTQSAKGAGALPQRAGSEMNVTARSSDTVDEYGTGSAVDSNNSSFGIIWLNRSHTLIVFFQSESIFWKRRR